MREYPKINSIFKRDKKTSKFIIPEWTLPEFEYLRLNRWVWTEKINGTNIRVKWWSQLDDLVEEYPFVEFDGKTDETQMHTSLIKKLQRTFVEKRLLKAFPDPVNVCLYGKGYGAKIEKGGGNYRPDVDFILFDVKIKEWWLRREDVEDIAQKLEIDVVPIIGEGTLWEAIEMTKKGFNSTFGDFLAEGMVLQPKVDLMLRNGGRVITKLKYKDFQQEK